MSRVSKEKQEKTLESMKDRRYNDTLFLREKMKDKVKWATEEKEKRVELIKKLEKQITILKAEIQNLNGAIAVLNQLQEEKKEKE
jgi:hypothetical protein